MAQEGYDVLLDLTDSRYRLSMIVARRAAQLKAGVPSLLEEGDVPDNGNTVTMAMAELRLKKPVRWGDDLPEETELREVRARGRREERVDEL